MKWATGYRCAHQLHKHQCLESLDPRPTILALSDVKDTQLLHASNGHGLGSRVGRQRVVVAGQILQVTPKSLAVTHVERGEAGRDNTVEMELLTDGIEGVVSGDRSLHVLFELTLRTKQYI